MSGAEALTTPRDAILPTELVGEGTLVAMSVEVSAGEYRAGDQIWLRQIGLRIIRVWLTATCWRRAPAAASFWPVDRPR
jgi:hypothetical protein